MTFRAIVVDDEPLARDGLADDLRQLGVDVVGSCGDGYSARAMIAAVRPDAVFLDIHMPEMDGFEVLEQLEPEDTPPVVIFVTAYDQHAVRAFEARALDYLLKPVSSARLGETVSRAQHRLEELRAHRDASSPGDPSLNGTLSQIVVRDRNEVIVIPVSDLEWIEAETYYVRLHAANMRPRLLRERMSVLESRLDPSRFFRTHRSAIVRLDLVRAIRSASRYEHSVLLSTGATVPLSRDRKAELELKLGG